VWSAVALGVARKKGIDLPFGLGNGPAAAQPWATAKRITPPGRNDPALLPIGDQTLVIALLGMDTNRASGVWRTDSIILVFIDQRSMQIGMLSVPRDLWVEIPDHGYSRINTVDALGERTQPGGGRVLLDRTFRHNLGVPVDRLVRIDFSGFVRVVDALGGVTVHVEQPIADTFPDPLSPTGEFHLDLPAGPQHLDGHTALAYCRSRMTTSDIDRGRRQRQVLTALWKQAFTAQNLAKAPKLWAALSDAFETDMQMVEAGQLANQVYGIGSEQVRSASIDWELVQPWTTPQGAQVLLPRTEEIKQRIFDLLTPPPE
jgi:LCP family protein required for cell wall assembly